MMAETNHRDLARVVLENYGQSYAEEIGIRLKDAPAPLFQLLVSALLLSARIAASNAVQAARALLEADLNTPQKMAAATWQERVDVITWHGYKRYDERTSTMLGETAQLLLDRYGGDLRQLRAAAERDVRREQQLLQQFKGIGPVGADIFLREVQGMWDEVYPYADARVARSARQIGLPSEPPALAELVGRDDFPRFVAGLVRVDLAKAHRDVQQQAASRAGSTG